MPHVAPSCPCHVIVRPRLVYVFYTLPNLRNLTPSSCSREGRGKENREDVE